jgi:hypothetical protein
MDPQGQLSPDGRWRWDGRTWVATGAPVPGIAGATGVRRIPGLRTGAAWKLAVAGIAALLVVAAIRSAGAPPPASSNGHAVAQVQQSAVPIADGSSPTPSHAPVTSQSPSPSPQPSPSPTPVPSPPPQAAPAPPPPPPPPAAQDPYPAATAAGASAVCADGTWSYSKSRSGTCSHHGGVHWWTGNLGPAGPGNH